MIEHRFPALSSHDSPTNTVGTASVRIMFAVLLFVSIGGSWLVCGTLGVGDRKKE